MLYNYKSVTYLFPRSKLDSVLQSPWYWLCLRLPILHCISRVLLTPNDTGMPTIPQLSNQAFTLTEAKPTCSFKLLCILIHIWALLPLWRMTGVAAACLKATIACAPALDCSSARHFPKIAHLLGTFPRSLFHEVISSSQQLLALMQCHANCRQRWRAALRLQLSWTP